MPNIMFTDKYGNEITAGVQPESVCDEAVHIACALIRGRWPRFDHVTATLVDYTDGAEELAEVELRNGMTVSEVRRALASLERNGAE